MITSGILQNAINVISDDGSVINPLDTQNEQRSRQVDDVGSERLFYGLKIHFLSSP